MIFKQKLKIFSSMSNTDDFQSNMLPLMLSHGSSSVVLKNSVCHILKWEFLQPLGPEETRVAAKLSVSL